MVFIAKDLSKISTRIQKELNHVEKELKNLPKGRLACENQGGRLHFVKEVYDGGQRKRQNLSSEDPVLKGLLKRQILEAERDQLMANHILLECTLDGVDAKKLAEKLKSSKELKSLIADGVKDFDLTTELYKIKNVFLQYASGKKQIKNNDFIQLLDEQIIKAIEEDSTDAWAGESYEKLQYQNNSTKWHITSFGLHVRSKSELMIAEMLHKYNLPFRYEQVLHFGSSTFAPDFTIKRSDGKIIYWEHEGLTNSNEYLNRQLRKSQVYAMNNIVPWDNLIVSYDSTDGLIDMRIVESEIQNKILV